MESVQLPCASCFYREADPANLPVEEVSVATGILKAASDLGCDLIVLGSHGRGAMERMLLGSVATKIVNSATVPVLITR